MSANSKLILILYLILIMNLICHLHTFGASRNLYKIRTRHQHLTEFKDEDTLVTSFSHPRFQNFTQFHIIAQNNHQSLFVISKNDTIIEFDIESMKMINNYTINACSYLMMPCQEHILINHLSEISFNDYKMLWFCYVMYQQNHPPLINCMVLTNKILTTDVRWQKIGYTSNSDQYKTFTVQSKDHIFIGSFVDNSLLIQRTKLPDNLGKIDSSKNLVTPMANFYFEKNSKILEAFETDNEVYFVVLEPVSAKSYSISDCLMSSDNRIVYVTRLIRICKKDEGGVQDHNEKNFGTIAKADLVCPIGTGKNEFLYKRAVSASWTNSKLYVLFENQKNSPIGQVICYFDVFAFKIVFNGPIRPPWIFLSSQKQERTITNPIPDVCDKLSSGLASENEKVAASSLSINGLYRTQNIMPVTQNPMMNFQKKNVKIIKAFPTGAEDLPTILIVHYDAFIEILSHTENNELCDISLYQLNNEESVNQISGTIFDNNIFALISTNQRVIRLKINNCEMYLTKSKCLDEAPNICGWDRKTMTCTLLNDRTDVYRSSCKHQIYNSVWSLPNICYVNDSQISLKCICKYCTDELMCKNKPKLEITNCSGIIEVGKWSEWQNWSPCSAETKLKTRKRKCLNEFPCMGDKEESQPCNGIDKTVFRSVWTQWYSASNTNIYNSFRSKCTVDNFGLIPAIEMREMVCENTCEERLFKWYKWSKWSDCTSQNVQYRLYNCSKLSQCPANKIQIQNCESVPFKRFNRLSEKDNNFGTIHLVLAVLVSSIIWVFILIFISVILLRMKLRSGKRSTSRHKPSYLKREYSETSNDYLSSDFKSTYDYNSSAFTENAAPTSKNICSQFALITEQNFNIASN